MGMYTELVLGVELEKDEKVLDILRYMLSDSDVCPECPKHPLFETDRWQIMLTCGSYYFDGHTDSSLLIDNIGVCMLNVRCNLKNYCGEIDKFLNWLAPYIRSHGFIGYTRHEEDDDPLLIYNENGKIIYRWAETWKERKQ